MALKMAIVILSTLFAIVYYNPGTNCAMDIPVRACEVYHKPGDVVIGGLFPIFRSEPKRPCESSQLSSITTSAELLAYTIDMINQRDDLLTNVTLGMEIRNDCAFEELTVWSMMTMTSNIGHLEFSAKCPNHTRGHDNTVVAVIGPSRSTNGLLAAKVGGLFSTPVISYSATSDELSDSSRFPYFFRTVPPDKFQVGAIMDLLQYFNWKYIALFYSIDTYGINAARQIQTRADELDICIPVSLPVASTSTERDLQNIREKLYEHNKVDVIVIFALRHAAYSVVKAISVLNRKFTIIGSDGVGLANTPDAQGGLFVDLFSSYDPDWYQHLAQLPSTSHVSHWYQNMANNMMAINNCSTWVSCEIPNPYMGTQITNAVLAIAHALNTTISKYCDGKIICKEALEGEVVSEHLQEVKFTSGDGLLFQFDENGDTSDKYVIWNLQEIAGKYTLVKVGNWDPYERNLNSRLVLNEHMLQWVDDTGIPKSKCEEECTVGHIVVPSEKPCCKRCQQCPGYSITINASACRDCARSEWPDRTFTTCLLIAPSFLQWTDFSVLLIFAFSLLGLTLCILTFIGLMYHQQHPLIKASSKELCVVNVCGLAVTLASVLFVIARATLPMCYMIEVGISVGFTLSFAPILLKVNRIWRIFVAARSSVRSPPFVGTKQQLIGVSLILVVQVSDSFLV
ncbi:metabotropic glutamate receptor 3-like [Amphiura filiformis]|uniref:metabotropic glutamate receptor 3-like n=1 Tax=Amphiura filiformis TaxID=82378 RepID=UPI003B222C57